MTGGERRDAGRRPARRMSRPTRGPPPRGTGPRRRGPGRSRPAGVRQMPGMASRPSRPPTDSSPVVVTSSTSGAASNSASAVICRVSTMPSSAATSTAPTAGSTSSMPVPFRRSAGSGRRAGKRQAPAAALVAAPASATAASISDVVMRGARPRATLRDAERMRRRPAILAAGPSSVVSRSITTTGIPSVRSCSSVSVGCARSVASTTVGSTAAIGSGVERPLVADVGEVVDLGWVGRRDVGGDDSIAEPEREHDLGEVAVDGHDPIDRRDRDLAPGAVGQRHREGGGVGCDAGGGEGRRGRRFRGAAVAATAGGEQCERADQQSPTVHPMEPRAIARDSSSSPTRQADSTQ